MKSITDTERQAIEKQEITEYTQKELRGTGYRMMHHRDKGWGAMQSVNGKEVILEWNIEGGARERAEYEAYTHVPEDCFLIRIGKESALIDKEMFRKLHRWV